MILRTASMTFDEIISLVDYSVDDTDGDFGDFTDLLVAKMYETCFYQLFLSVSEYGFLDPICIQETPAGYYMGNGHHRLALAMLMCYEGKLDVVFSDDDYMESAHTSAHEYDNEFLGHLAESYTSASSFYKLLDEVL